jgi:hypothetical protein
MSGLIGLAIVGLVAGCLASTIADLCVRFRETPSDSKGLTDSFKSALL